MQSQLTVRLSGDLDREVSNCAKRLRLKRSDIVRMALKSFLEGGYRIGEEIAPYERVKNLLGSVSSGIPDLGQNHRKHIIKKIKRHA
ncbi:MAG: hypothetical protein HY754_10680 [Nitrospirae bacterium]|nr:hypothetical protein [Nitrospirota bacterium]